jgi:hypothetical protein
MLMLLTIAYTLAAAAALGGTATGNADGDGDVDLTDFAAFQLCYTGPGVAIGDPDCEVFDFDGDNDIDLTDFNAFQLAFTGADVPMVFEAELAGRSLVDYPNFEYVRALQDDDDIEVAIDPTQYPNIVGETCDIYVVAAKSEAEWDGDASLVDVRPGGPDTETFVGGTIQANTFLAAAAGSLNSDAGTDLGVGYDVVLDCNQNGLLGGGDYIDGRGDEAGFYACKDTTEGGPLDWIETIYTGGTFLNQDLYYPTTVGDMGELPVVIVSHGNGHNYQWYDHIGEHLASYGYIVMSHSNNTGPGSHIAAGTTFSNTEYLLGNLDTIAGGALEGHVDNHRITWIGHSRGAEGVVYAYTRVVEGSAGFIPTQFTADDVKLISSIAPVTHQGFATQPFDVNFHLFIAAADNDVQGNPGSGSKPLAIYERSTGNRQVTYCHGVGHGDFHDGGGSSVAAGPDLIGRPATHQIVRGYYLPMVKYYIDGNLPAKDYLTRSYHSFHPVGIGANVIISREYRDALSVGNRVIEDFETETGLATASSGAAVSGDVLNLFEGLMRDDDGSFVFSPTVPMNGMTRYKVPGDDADAAVFDWNPSSTSWSLEWDVVPGDEDFGGFNFLSFRACQGTRHPETDALDDHLDFTVTLVDGDGVSSSINFGEIGKITRTYERTGSGAGAGWANEFDSIRLRLTDFRNNGSGLNLSDIDIVRFEFGSDHGSNRGRLGIDDIELVME